jgi:putative transposase
VVITSVRREVVDYFKSRGHTERRACELASLQRSTCRYQSRREDDPKLVARLRKIAEERPRFGVRPRRGPSGRPLADVISSRA